ncbi:hypothetical protein PTSG_08081 [Salpingoeca rosetta]|uniref:NADH dehydrogenase [ubiquinone] 1 alpha subcomplex subunit 13 n=1 Tax=Salpingoeca rosetta (strain ATCC 50818 / BSB-021) TaxID=946362 RepID=F2UHY1_SALR5|nr:uncharacterized protein PTSG_08081 [Salpingoeca rosetta]EGD76730.1 hypothetical protein PTSG_08081 [Salpingoeca rosetta]|eukprot:XP_004991102.1 hypothetical protein PTSG_08081 [Salpingoeca rosetta]
MSTSTLQDRPRPGGFPTINYARNVPKRGPSGLAIVLGGAAVFVLGMYKINEGRRQRKLLHQENVNSRLVLEPFLNAEKDRRYIQQVAEQLEAESIIMRDVKGWKVGERVYNTDRFIPPAQRLDVEYKHK